jgi:hypothetical protein
MNLGMEALLRQRRFNGALITMSHAEQLAGIALIS